MGILIAITIIFLWLGHLLYLFFFIEINFQSPLLYLHVLIQAYLYTGLFITAHDAMHGTVAKTESLIILSVTWLQHSMHFFPIRFYQKNITCITGFRHRTMIPIFRHITTTSLFGGSYFLRITFRGANPADGHYL
jgi:hypothetical protein